MVVSHKGRLVSLIAFDKATQHKWLFWLGTSGGREPFPSLVDTGLLFDIRQDRHLNTPQLIVCYTHSLPMSSKTDSQPLHATSPPRPGAPAATLSRTPLLKQAGAPQRPESRSLALQARRAGGRLQASAATVPPHPPWAAVTAHAAPSLRHSGAAQATPFLHSCLKPNHR